MFPNSVRQPEKRERKTTLTVFASRALTRETRSSSAFSSLGNSAFRAIRARWVKMKSRAVIGTPSLQRASGRMWYVSVNGGFLVKVTRETSLGRNVKPGPTSNAVCRTFSPMNKIAGPDDS